MSLLYKSYKVTVEVLSTEEFIIDATSEEGAAAAVEQMIMEEEEEGDVMDVEIVSVEAHPVEVVDGDVVESEDVASAVEDWEEVGV